MKINYLLKLAIGIFISALFLFLAFKNVQLTLMISAIKNINLTFIVLIFFTMFFYEWVRAWRWKYLLLPIRKIKTNRLFAALMIGYSANIIVPAHLGEFVRAFVIGKRSNLKASSAFATIVTERLLDMISLLIILGVALFMYPFPNWAKKSGVLFLVITIFLVLFILFFKKSTSRAQYLLLLVLKPLPNKIKSKIIFTTTSFLDGFIGLKNWQNYLMLILLTMAIWLLYVLSFLLGFWAFNFHLPIITGITLVIFTTISIVIPSSPGYIGTYHWACQLGLSLFGVSESFGMGFALVMHGILTTPFFFIGLLFAWNEGLQLSKLSNAIKMDSQPSAISTSSIIE